MMTTPRSLCPINLALEIFGDRWSLLILRDMIFAGKRHFRDLMRSDEGIASNILAERLTKLVDAGLLTRADDPSHKQKAVYSLTEKAIALVPALVQIGAWGSKHLPASEALSIRPRMLQKGGPKMWDAFMAELREVHLGAPARARSRSVGARLDAAYQDVVAHRRRPARRKRRAV